MNPQKQWTCPGCNKDFNSQGKGGHLYSIHGVRTEKELLEVMSGKEIKLLPYTPEHVSGTETVTRVTKSLFSTPVPTSFENTRQTPINIEKTRVEKHGTQHVSETPVNIPKREHICGRCGQWEEMLYDKSYYKMNDKDHPEWQCFELLCPKCLRELREE